MCIPRFYTAIIALLFIGLVSLSSYVQSRSNAPVVQQVIDIPVYYLLDEQGDATIGDVVTRFDSGRSVFRYVQPVNEGITDSVLWIGFSVPDTAFSSSLSTLYVHIGNPGLGTIAVFESGLPYGTYPTLGSSQPFSERYIHQTDYVIPIHRTEVALREFLIRIDSSTSLRASIDIQGETQFFEQQLANQFLLGAYYGLIIIMCCYYFLVFSHTKEVMYFYFTASLVALVAVQLNFDGYLFQYLYPDAPSIAFSVLVISVVLVYIFAFLFARHFLSTRAYAPNIDKLFSGMAWLGVLVILCALSASEYATLLIGMPYCLASGLLCFVAGMNSVLNGHRSGMFYLAAISTVTLGSFAYILMYIGWVPASMFVVNVLKLSTIIEVLLLSFALTDRIRMMRAEKEALKDAMLKSLEEQNTSKDEFLAVVSHELRTPMNGVQGALDLVRYQPLQTQIREYVDMAAESASGMVTLINDVLDFTELQNGKSKIKRSNFSLIRDVTKLYQGYQKCHENDDVSFLLEIDDDVPAMVKGDSQKLFKILKHLLNNAVNYTASGHVILRVSCNECAGEVYQIAFTITDTGCGISQEKQARIFEPFTREDASMSRAQGGIGLGLAIAKNLVDAMGGELTFFSEKGVGTEFVLVLSMNAVLSDNAYPVKGIDSDDLLTGRLQVLVVEDNVVNQKVLAGILTKLGHETVLASNGLEGVQLANSKVLDLILMDCQMPVMDGLEATRKIRDNQHLNHVPIIAVTANATSDDEARCLDAGMDDFMAKPVNRGAINRIIHKWGKSASAQKSEPTGKSSKRGDLL